MCALCFGPLQNDYTQAIEVYKRALVIKPDFHAILVNLGSCHQQAWIAWIASGTVESSKLASRLRVHRAHAGGWTPVHVRARCVRVHVCACARLVWAFSFALQMRQPAQRSDMKSNSALL